MYYIVRNDGAYYRSQDNGNVEVTLFKVWAKQIEQQYVDSILSTLSRCNGQHSYEAMLVSL